MCYHSLLFKTRRIQDTFCVFNFDNGKKKIILTYFDNLRTRMIKHDILSLTE